MGLNESISVMNVHFIVDGDDYAARFDFAHGQGKRPGDHSIEWYDQSGRIIGRGPRISKESAAVEVVVNPVDEDGDGGFPGRGALAARGET